MVLLQHEYSSRTDQTYVADVFALLRKPSFWGKIPNMVWLNFMTITHYMLRHFPLIKIGNLNTQSSKSPNNSVIILWNGLAKKSQLLVIPAQIHSPGIGMCMFKNFRNFDAKLRWYSFQKNFGTTNDFLENQMAKQVKYWFAVQNKSWVSCMLK